MYSRFVHTRRHYVLATLQGISQGFPRNVFPWCSNCYQHVMFCTSAYILLGGLPIMFEFGEVGWTFICKHLETLQWFLMTTHSDYFDIIFVSGGLMSSQYHHNPNDFAHSRGIMYFIKASVSRLLFWLYFDLDFTGAHVIPFNSRDLQWSLLSLMPVQ